MATKIFKINIQDRKSKGKLATIEVPIDRSISLTWQINVIKAAVGRWADKNNRKMADLAWEYAQ